MKPAKRRVKRQLASQHDRVVAGAIASELRKALEPYDSALLLALAHDAAGLLEYFKTHGTFAHSVTKAAHERRYLEVVVLEKFMRLRPEKSYEGAVADLVEEFHRSESTIRNLVRPATRKRGAPPLK